LEKHSAGILPAFAAADIAILSFENDSKAADASLSGFHYIFHK